TNAWRQIHSAQVHTWPLAELQRPLAVDEPSKPSNVDFARSPSDDLAHLPIALIPAAQTKLSRSLIHRCSGDSRQCRMDFTPFGRRVELDEQCVHFFGPGVVCLWHSPII